MYFCSFVTKCNQASTKYSPDVFKSFYRTVTHGGFHGIFKPPPFPLSNKVSLHSTIEPKLQELQETPPSPHFTVEPLPSVASPFFSLKTPSPLQKIHNTSIGPGKPPHTLFFCFKQNPLFGAPFSPHTRTPPQGICSFNRP